MVDHPLYIISMLGVAAAATLFWRVLGMIIGQRFHADHPFIQWVTALAFSTVTALSLKLLLFPEGHLGDTPLAYRIGVLGVSFTVFYLTGKNLLAACLTGVGLFGGLLIFF